ncbi:MFS transporter [Streptomyces kunmingensis]|uniref:MFS transporter n=1 Tax=Streptomyces kunmingensis TaxID=68225 RepID=A0ABU6CLX5_9ACTN|nr:MFS transporter [Streptomyces kunmingensis]MEB3965057.1 MFS transporter [Streptomyces kunmingensis]
MTNLLQEPTPRTRPGSRARGGLGTAVLAVGLLTAAFNLRIGVASVGPVLSDIQADLGLSEVVVSLLTTIPVIAFGAFAFVTPALSRRLGLHRLLGATMIALAVGIALRLQPGLTGLFAGTVVVGASIAIANVIMPAAIKGDFSGHVGLMMGLYSTALSVGAAFASGATVPLLSWVGGGGWRPTLALWAIPALIAFLILIPQLRHTSVRGTRMQEPAVAEADVRADAGEPAVAEADARADAGEPSVRALMRDPVAIAVTALMGLQSMSYYATLTWVPTLFQDAGMDAHSAGWMLSYAAFLGMAASLVTPAMARRTRPTWLPVAIAVALTGAAFAGLAAAPTSAAYVWMTMLGLGQGASLSLSLTYIVWRSPDARHTGHVSMMAQGLGYLLAGLGPIGLGALHTATGGWSIPLMTLIGLLALQLWAGVLAGRQRHVLR